MCITAWDESPERISEYVKEFIVDNNFEHKFGVYPEFNVGFGVCFYDEEKVGVGEWTRRNVIAEFYISDIQSNSSAAFSTATFVSAGNRNSGIATFMMKLKIFLCKKFNIKMLLATVNSENSAEKHILEKFGWKEVSIYNAGYSLYVLEVEKIKEE